MRFTATASVILLLAFSAIGAGLEFSLTRNRPAVLSQRSECGILLCRETSLGSRRYGGVNNIKNLTIFKTFTTGLDNSGSIEPSRFTRLASVSSTQPKLDQVSNGMKISGTFKEGDAVLEIKLSKEIDCSAEYVCEVTGVNSVGENIVNSRSLIQQPAVESSLEASSSTTILMARILALVEEQSTKLAVVEEKLNAQGKNLEEKTQALSEAFEKKTESIVEQVNAECVKLEESINLQHEKLLTISKSSERLEDNVEKINEKICQLDLKLSVIDSEAIQNKVLKAITTQINEHFSKVLNASDLTNQALNETAVLITSISSQNRIFQVDVKECYQQLFSNVTQEMQKLFERDKNLTESLQSKFLSLKNDVNISFKRLESSANKSTVTTMKALQDTASDKNLALTNNIESALKDFFKPKTCQKNQYIPYLPLNYNGLFISHFPGLDVPVLCDAVTRGGGWIIIQRRSTGEVDFYRDWASYKEGFGSLDTEFWLGNENIYKITSRGDFELRVDLKYEEKFYYAAYSNFSVAGEDSDYTLTVEGYSGTAGDSLSLHNSQRFSTFDRDNDKWASVNCAKANTGAWWYKDCHDSNLNGKWGGDNFALFWRTLTPGRSKSVSFSEIKIRPKH